MDDAILPTIVLGMAYCHTSCSVQGRTAGANLLPALHCITEKKEGIAADYV
jgi:hypothetical protein